MPRRTAESFDFRKLTLAAGEKKRFDLVAHPSLINVNPGAGATVKVQYLVTPDGTPFDWQTGDAVARASNLTPGPLAAVIVTSTAGAASTAELCSVD